MQEVMQEIIDYLKGIWIKRRYIIISTWLICPLGWYFVAAMPDVYKSEARVYVDTQSLLRPLLRGAIVETNPNTQIRLMVRTLLGRENLERISRMTDLDVQARNSKEYEALLDKLKSNIKISSAGRENIYTISYQDSDAELARNIVQSTLTVFTENTLGENRSDADSAQKFLDAQLKELESRLSADEAKLTAFKQKYSDILPGKSGGFYSQLGDARSGLKSIELEILENKTRLASAKEQLEASTINSTDPSGKIRTDSSIQTTFDQRIYDLEAQLDALKLRYTDKHPDVMQVSQSLELLNEQRAQEISKYLEEAKNSGDNYAAINQSPVTQEVQIQINQLENTIASLNVRANDYRNRVSTLEGKIHTLPEIEAELVALNRGYSVTKRKYEDLLSRKETAMLAQQADETTERIQFKVIDPPRASDKPTGPARYVFFGFVTVLGIGVGLGVSLLMSQINPIVTSMSQLTRATGVPVFGVVSANENLGLQRWQRKKTLLFMLSNILLFCVLFAFISYFMFPDIIQAPLKRIF